MQLHFTTLKIFIFILLAQPVFSQCFITNCSNPAILTGDANWVDGTQGSTNGELSITGISIGNVDCMYGVGEVGIEAYVYQLLPDGSRVSLCDVTSPEPDNFIYKFPIYLGPVSDCTDTATDLPDIQITDHESNSGSSEIFLCEGGVYEVILVLFTRDDNQFIEVEQSVFSALNAGQYVELNLGTFFVNYTNEFDTPNPYPIPKTTAVITGPNGETGTMQANCGEEVSLFFEGLSYIGRCRFDEENVPNFYTFCDPSDPYMTNGTYSPSITSEAETFLFYTVNGGAPVIIRNGNGGDPATDAYGGQQTGPGNLPGLGPNECYTGVCGVRGVPAPESFCDGDVIVVTLQTLDIYTDITAEDQMTITYSGGECSICEPVCPFEANIEASATEVCSGESLIISGTAVGEGEVIFTISESSGTISEIIEGVEFTLPENNTCVPVTYIFNATAFCEDGNEITNGSLSVDITVYPSEISAFVTTNDGECTTSVSVDAACGTNVSVNPSETQTANPGESGVHNYTVTWSGGGPSCASDLNLTATYNCPPDITCPSSADITISSDQICSGESITINGTTSGEGTGTFTISESTGTITEINEGVALALPENNACEAITYTFTATAVCDDDGSAIPGGNLTATVTVYPTDISAFVTANDGECTTSVTIDDSCGNNISVNPSESQTANPGESGVHNYTVTWSGSGPSCASDLNLTATYNCPPDITCPSSADITISSDQICSGESITINGTTSGEGTGAFTISESTGTITEINEGVALALPENNTCEAITYTFTASAICDDDGSTIPGGNLTAAVTVYPTDISAFVTTNDGECTTSVSVDAACGTNVLVNPSETQTANPGESGIHNYTVTWSGGGPSCASDLNLTATYNCPPDIVCPASASISVSASELCSGESITISGTTEGEGSATFTIAESSGVVGVINEGEAFTLPENSTCSPIIYTFNATATCVDDGSEITNGTQSTTVTVYPTDISAFVSSADGECLTNVSVDASCGTNITISPSQSQSANPGESGTHNYTASWSGGGPSCTSDINLTATYNCPPDIVCPASASISASTNELCSGESLTISGIIIVEGLVDFTLTESSGAVGEINDGEAFTLPENNTCAPVVYTFNATAICTDDGSEITDGLLSVDVTVYPSDINAFVTTNEGECLTSVSVDASCGTNVSISPSDNQTANPGESGVHNYTASWAGGGPSCASDVNLTATYNCPPDIVCPASANISASLTEVCSGESITISGTTVGEGSANFMITSSGFISVISEGVAFSMPENDTCAPVTYTFNATATCADDGSEITNGSLSADVKVYPSDISAFVMANDGACSTTITIDESCGSNISISPAESQTANSGESGIHNYTASWTGGGPNCVTNLPLMPAYNCVTCPTEASISISDTEVCSGESVVISGTTLGDGTASFEITDESGSVTDITKDVVFNMPANITCTPVTYTFTAVAICEDDGSEIPGSVLSVDVIVYPTQIANFLSINEGDCSTSVIIDPDCADNVSVSPSESQSANAGESGTHEYIFSWIGGGLDCVPDENLLGNYNCPTDIVCPSSANIIANVTELCSAGSIIISGEAVGVGEASFTITESTGTLVNIVDGENVDLPENLTCNPVSYTFNATATCVADGSEITNGVLSVDVTVYPSDINAFVSNNDGTCSTNVSIDSSCGDNISITPALSQTANPGESGTHNYTASWTGGGSFCFADEMLTANYNCPTDNTCPSEASVTADVSEICSGESATITGSIIGEGSASFVITESTGTITAIEDGIAFTLPENSTCEPVVYTFNATATCNDDGSEISGGTLSVDITVYPSDISAFISSNDGECSTNVIIDASCDTNISISPAENQSANPGESGVHNYIASWAGGGPSCVTDLDLTANYNCPAEIICPAEANIISNTTEICSGESAIISGASTGEGTATFTITETTGTITDISNEVAFDLPANETCTPITYVFAATAICEEDGSEITNGMLSAEITVYPTDVSAFITVNDGECSTSISIDASCGNNISVTPALSQTASTGESGTHNYTAGWAGGGPACLADQMLTADYNCPDEIVCPTSANITVNTNEICSGETVVISGEYEGGGAAIYTITETSGTISGIESGVSLSLPENTTCGPETYTFELTSATCVADGSAVPVNQTNIEVIVYPSDISSYISTIENNCITTVNIASVCEELLTVFPGNEQLAEIGAQAGTHNYTISWNESGSCVMDIEIDLQYTCDCVFDPTLAELELVSGGTEVCFGSTIEYKAKYDGEDIDLNEGGIDESYAAAFLIFIEPIDFNQPPQDPDVLYRVTNETILNNDESIPPGTYYIYYYQGLDPDDPIGDEALCKLYSQDYLVVEVLPEITSGEAICTGYDGSNEVTISVADGSGSALPNDTYVENNGIQYAYETIEVVDTTKILTFVNLPDGYYFFYYEDAQSCSSTDLLLEFNCESQTYDCPANVAIESLATAQCSKATISLNANIAGSSEYTTINWFDDLGNAVDDPGSVNLPFNSGCDPIEIGFVVEVGCSQDPDFVTLSDMITILIYPTDVSAFVEPLSGACTVGVDISDACSAETLLAESTTVSAGESGTTDILVSYPGNPCIEDFSVAVSYDCPADAGCTDVCAPNYNPDATENDNSCEPYDNTCNDDCTAGDLSVWDEATCSCVTVETIDGCTDTEACNYNADANCEDGSCQFASCNADPCMGDVEMIDPADACNCIITEMQNIGCDDPTALNYDATVNCADNSTCAYVGGAPPVISISELCYCGNEQNIDLDGDGNIDLVAETITISASPGDMWTLTSNGTPPALDAQNVALLTDGSVVVPETSTGVYTITIYHPANGVGYGTLTFSNTTSTGSIQILEVSNTDGCACDAECNPPIPGNFECDE